jgi:hypothetical protein
MPERRPIRMGAKTGVSTAPRTGGAPRGVLRRGHSGVSHRHGYQGERLLRPAGGSAAPAASSLPAGPGAPPPAPSLAPRPEERLGLVGDLPEGGGAGQGGRQRLVRDRIQRPRRKKHLPLERAIRTGDRTETHQEQESSSVLPLPSGGPSQLLGPPLLVPHLHGAPLEPQGCFPRPGIPQSDSNRGRLSGGGRRGRRGRRSVAGSVTVVHRRSRQWGVSARDTYP